MKIALANNVDTHAQTLRTTFMQVKASLRRLLHHVTQLAG